MVKKLVVSWLAWCVLCTVAWGMKRPIDYRELNLSQVSMEGLISDLVSLPGTMEDDACRHDLQNYTNHFMQSRSILYLFLYTGKGINELGDYKNCKKNNGLYLVLDMLMNTYPVITIGGCVPLQCTPQALHQYHRNIAQFFNRQMNRTIFSDNDVYIYNPVEKNAEISAINAGTVISFLLFGLGIGVAIGVLVYEYVRGVLAGKDGTKESEKDTLKATDKEPATGAEKEAAEAATNLSTWERVLDCFNLAKNANGLFYGENRVDKNLDVLNGLRVLAMFWIIFGHTLVEYFTVPVFNRDDILMRLMNDRIMTLFTSATLAVDVFFMLSGFFAVLGCEQAFKQSKNRTVGAVFKLYLLRYIRLLPIYVVAILLGNFVAPLLYDGPIYKRITTLQNSCSQHWIFNFLYLNNFVKPREMCYEWTWYLSNDFQLYLIVPLIVLLRFATKRGGYLVVGILALGSVIVQTVVFNVYNIDLYIFDGPKELDLFEQYYIKPYCRINVYLLGIVFAWIYLGRDKEDSKACSFNEALKNLRVLRYPLYVVGFNIIFLILFINPVFYRSERRSVGEALLYTVLARPAFVLALLLIFYPALLGKCRGSILLSNGFWACLARSTYCAYMIHLIVYQYYTATLEEGIYFNIHKMILNSLDVIVISYILSLVLTLLFESPVLQLTKLCLRKGQRTPPKPAPLSASDSDSPTGKLMAEEAKS